jgi:hypothetical protein
MVYQGTGAAPQSKTTTKVPGPFVVEMTFAGQTITTFDVFWQNRDFHRML